MCPEDMGRLVFVAEVKPSVSAILSAAQTVESIACDALAGFGTGLLALQQEEKLAFRYNDENT